MSTKKKHFHPPQPQHPPFLVRLEQLLPGQRNSLVGSFSSVAAIFVGQQLAVRGATARRPRIVTFAPLPLRFSPKEKFWPFCLDSHGLQPNIMASPEKLVELLKGAQQRKFLVTRFRSGPPLHVISCADAATPEAAGGRQCGSAPVVPHVWATATQRILAENRTTLAQPTPATFAPSRRSCRTTTTPTRHACCGWCRSRRPTRAPRTVT